MDLYKSFKGRLSEISPYKKTTLDIVTLNFYYFFALRLVTILSFTSITPNQITIIGALFEISAAVLIISPYYHSLLWLIVLLLQVKWIFDLSDGVLARYKKLNYYHTTSPTSKGWFLDAILDQTLRFIIIGTLAYRLQIDLGYGWQLGIIALVIHASTMFEDTMEKVIILDKKLRDKIWSKPLSPRRGIMQEVALIANRIHIYFLIFLPFNRIDILLVLYAMVELILFLKRSLKFMISGI